MNPTPGAHEMTDGAVSADIQLKVGSNAIQTRLTVPAAPVKGQAVLPALHVLVDAVVRAAEQELEGTGRRVSCTAGCAACCRQAVSISTIEAYHIDDLVAAMPEPRRRAVRARFADVGRRLTQAGLYQRLMDPGGLTADQREALALDYFALGISCPFLKAEACTIYADRPLSCREYLVASPPAGCATPGSGDVEPVPVPSLSRALRRTALREAEARSLPPLSLALDWVAVHPDDLPLRSGPDWVRDILGRASR